MPTYSERILNEFATKQWNKTLEYLKRQFSLDEEDCRDVFQDSFLILHEQNNSGKLKDLTASLSTYFISICRNKALELRREKNKQFMVENEQVVEMSEAEMLDEKINFIIDTFDSETEFQEQKENLVRQIVHELPEPCNHLLWGSFRDNLSIATLAKMYDYSVGSVKVIKHRCMEKFRIRYGQLVKSLFD